MRKLVYWPAAILKRVSEPLTEAPPADLVSDMREIMKARNGAGISAVQVGELKRLVLVAEQNLVFVNPVITELIGTPTPLPEGCLSVPGFFEYIKRYPSARVTYQDQEMKLHENQVFHGFIAHVLQHELEHLDGKLYLDHLTPAQRSRIMGNMQALRRAGKLK